MPGNQATRRSRGLGRGEIDGQSSPLPQPERKAPYVHELFVRIAGRYDLMNRVMTFGRDRTWRRATVAEALVPILPVDSGSDPAWVLDVATGTGDLALEVISREPGVQVVGLDFVTQMLALAQEKGARLGERLPAGESNRVPSWLVGDALRLPFPDRRFDAVVTGFALRNVADISAAFAEMARVTRPGGRVACLEITRPRQPVIRHLFAFYFYRIVPFVGGLITGQRLAYSYLPHSLTRFLTPEEIVAVMRDAGWSHPKIRRLMLGTVALHTAIRM